MTLEELRLYDGKKNPKIYIGVKNIVFDCTSNECNYNILNKL